MSIKNSLYSIDVPTLAYQQHAISIINELSAHAPNWKKNGATGVAPSKLTLAVRCYLDRLPSMSWL